MIAELDDAGATGSSVNARRLTTSVLAGAAMFLALYFPDRGDGSGAVLGGVFAFGAFALGLGALGEVRPLPQRSALERLRLMGLSLAAGIALGIANLMVNYGIAMLDAGIYRQMIEQWSHFSAWSAVIAGPMVEEIGYRLLLMGGTAWLVSRVTDNRRTAFVSALAVSAALFGVAHILPSSRPTTGALHATAVALKSGAGGVVLGWIFWRRGLPYSMACHGTANAAHLLAAPLLFG